jgi:acetyltransferase-like isoleucine patch superfamily enzyme
MIYSGANIDPAARIGRDCEIHAGVWVGANAVLGAEVWIGMGTLLVGAIQIGDRCRIGAGCVLDPSREAAGTALEIESDVTIEPGVVVAGAVRIARGARILAGSVVQRPVPPHAIVSGNPAQIVGYESTAETSSATSMARPGTNDPGVRQTIVRGVTLHRFPRIFDLRGNLTVGEFGSSVPFLPKRYFIVFDVPNVEVRGEHAHRSCAQFLVCVRGQCSVVADDGTRREEFLLDDPSLGLYLPPMTWGIQYKYSADGVLLVFASELYESAEYIRDYDEFRQLVAGE